MPKWYKKPVDMLYIQLAKTKKNTVDIEYTKTNCSKEKKLHWT